MGSWFLKIRGVIGEPRWKVRFSVLSPSSSGGGDQRPPLAGFSHSFLPRVDSVRALWRSTRMNSLNSFPERLTMLKTNFGSKRTGKLLFPLPPALTSLWNLAHSPVCVPLCPPAPPNTSSSSLIYEVSFRVIYGLGTWVDPHHSLPVSFLRICGSSPEIHRGERMMGEFIGF